MKKPKTFNQEEPVLEQFVIAADTRTLDSACDLLFIHAHDLTWGEQGLGLFLVHVDTDENFDEVIEVAEARSKLSFSSVVGPVLRPFEARFIKILAEVGPQIEKQTDAKEREKIIGSAIAAEFANETTRAELNKIAPEVFGLDQWISFADAIASSLLRDAISLRQRQLASTGKSEEDYQAMLYALQRLDLCDRIAHVAYPNDSLNLEISMAAQGEFRATATLDDSNVVEWLRLKSDLASLKRGQEKALPLFIAAYVNSHYPGSRQAFACAQYGEQSEPDKSRYQHLVWASRSNCIKRHSHRLTISWRIWLMNSGHSCRHTQMPAASGWSMSVTSLNKWRNLLQRWPWKQPSLTSKSSQLERV